MAVSHADDTVSIHALPSGELVRSIGSKGSGKGQFDAVRKLCFTAHNGLLVVESGNKRVQEVTPTGEHVRFIGAGGLFKRGIVDPIWGIAASETLIAVAKADCTSKQRIMLFDAVTGLFVSAFGDYGNAPGQVMKFCRGVRFTPDGQNLVVAEADGSGACRVSMFTIAGELVQCIGQGELKRPTDVEFAGNGDLLVCDAPLGGRHRVCVYSGNGGLLLRQWGGVESDAEGKFRNPAAMAMRGSQLYVLDCDSARVQVFE